MLYHEVERIVRDQIRECQNNPTTAINENFILEIRNVLMEKIMEKNDHLTSNMISNIVTNTYSAFQNLYQSRNGIISENDLDHFSNSVEQIIIEFAFITSRLLSIISDLIRKGFLKYRGNTTNVDYSFFNDQVKNHIANWLADEVYNLRHDSELLAAVSNNPDGIIDNYDLSTIAREGLSAILDNYDRNNALNEHSEELTQFFDHFTAPNMVLFGASNSLLQSFNSLPNTDENNVLRTAAQTTINLLNTPQIQETIPPSDRLNILLCEVSSFMEDPNRTLPEALRAALSLLINRCLPMTGNELNESTHRTFLNTLSNSNQFANAVNGTLSHNTPYHAQASPGPRP